MDPIEQKDLALMRARINDMGVLHPKARGAFLLLANDLHRAFLDGRTHVHFKAFETFRSPWRQKASWTTGLPKRTCMRARTRSDSQSILFPTSAGAGHGA